MKLSAVISLTLVSVVTAIDSCEVLTDYLCGDVCIGQPNKCHCGNDILKGYWADYNFYCCIPPGDDRQQCYQDGGAGHCPAGRKLRTSEQCDGHCFNEYQNYNNTRLGADHNTGVMTDNVSGYSVCVYLDMQPAMINLI